MAFLILLVLLVVFSEYPNLGASSRKSAPVLYWYIHVSSIPVYHWLNVAGWGWDINFYEQRWWALVTKNALSLRNEGPGRRGQAACTEGK